MRKNQDAFTPLGIVIVLGVALALALAGWFVWSKNSDSPPKKTTTNQTATPPADNQEYLVIKEWGVKVPLSNKLKDAYYEYRAKGEELDGTPLLPDGTIRLSTAAFDAANGRLTSCRHSNPWSKLIFVRAKPGDTRYLSGSTDGGPHTSTWDEQSLQSEGGIKLGAYYYYEQEVIYTLCSIEGADEDQALTRQLQADMRAAFKSITAL